MPAPDRRAGIEIADGAAMTTHHCRRARAGTAPGPDLRRALQIHATLHRELTRWLHPELALVLLDRVVRSTDLSANADPERALRAACAAELRARMGDLMDASVSGGSGARPRRSTPPPVPARPTRLVPVAAASPRAVRPAPVTVFEEPTMPSAPEVFQALERFRRELEAEDTTVE